MPDIVMSKELAAMAQLEQGLQELTDEERGRVLNWAAARFGVVLVLKGRAPLEGAEQNGGSMNDEQQTGASEVDSLAEFYDLASPETDGEKSLIVGYWLSVKQGNSELEAQKINSELKHLGHGIGNVTRALDWLKAQKPALMIQKRKEGTTKQARKKFVVTNEGKKLVEKMISGS